MRPSAVIIALEISAIDFYGNVRSKAVVVQVGQGACDVSTSIMIVDVDARCCGVTRNMDVFALTVIVHSGVSMLTAQSSG